MGLGGDVRIFEMVGIICLMGGVACTCRFKHQQQQQKPQQTKDTRTTHTQRKRGNTNPFVLLVGWLVGWLCFVCDAHNTHKQSKHKHVAPSLEWRRKHTHITQTETCAKLLMTQKRTQNPRHTKTESERGTVANKINKQTHKTQSNQKPKRSSKANVWVGPVHNQPTHRRNTQNQKQHTNEETNRKRPDQNTNKQTNKQTNSHCHTHTHMAERSRLVVLR